MKTCTKCKEVKPFTEFHKDKNKKDGLVNHCKPCVKHRHHVNREAIAETSKRYYQANREAMCAHMKQWRKDNADHVKRGAKQYQIDNKEAIDAYWQNRRANDPLFKLKGNIRSLIYQSIANGGYSKKSKTHEILGCSFDEYYKHIESQFTDGMSWERMSEIHIDHRLPLSAATTEAELLALNHHRNLQPLWSADNLSKGGSYCPKELAAYFAKYL